MALAMGSFKAALRMYEAMPMAGIREWAEKSLLTYGVRLPVVCCCNELMK
jgi:hypothetical protein